ncbi:PAS domain S-box protein [Actinoplanes sp. NPDC048796]|uniref:sensor histidine kinase n=1 Tax=Actinoplanes sp. NPDC048796 TaxID=3155640 RepID=UPI0033F71728
MRRIRPALVPLLIWLVLVAVGTAVLSWQQYDSRQSVAQRFNLRVGLIGDFVTSYTGDLMERERVQARASLSDPVVDERDFARATAGFGYPAAVLLDSKGRALQVVPHDATIVGKDLASRYGHLWTALHEGRAAVSPVVSSVVRGLPVVAFAVPYQTTSGRRVFSGAVEIRDSPLSSYLSTALTYSGAEVQLVDGNGSVVAANGTLDGAVPTLAGKNEPLAAALRQHTKGRYQAGGRWWRYSSTPIEGTPWRLSATVPEDVLFATLTGNELAGRAGLGGAAVVGLLVVLAAGRVRRSRQHLRLSEDRFRKVFDGSRIGMTLTDTEGRYVRVNPAAAELFGRSEADLIGRRSDDITHPDDVGRAAGFIRDCLSGRIDGFDLEKRYVHADGRIIDASVTSALLRDTEGRPQYFAMQIIDTTERRALERARLADRAELAERAEQLQQVNAHLGDVMAMLSHDVRQPLTRIIGLGELLLDDWEESTSEAKLHDVRRMTAAGHSASELVTDILTLAQLDAGALVARPVRVDLPHLVRAAVTGEQVTVVAPDEIYGFADPKHLQLILGNLLANAAKYGEPPVTVTVANRRDHVEIKVADEGEGVPEAFVEHLFDRFARAESGVATRTSGTGLGLYLVRQLAQAGGLDVSYRPNQPRGAAFLVTVPHAYEAPAFDPRGDETKRMTSPRRTSAG